MNEKATARFWKHVDKSSTMTTCWNWTGCLYWCGYGSFNCEKKMLYAHRVSYALKHGAIPEGMQVLHKCDNRLCVNPDHLFIGTNADNVRDKMEKGRQAKGARHGEAVRAVQPRGENAPTAKLTEQQVLEIKRIYRRGVRGYGARILAARFGIKPQSVQAIVNGRSWTHI